MLGLGQLMKDASSWHVGLQGVVRGSQEGLGRMGLGLLEAGAPGVLGQAYSWYPKNILVLKYLGFAPGLGISRPGVLKYLGNHGVPSIWHILEHLEEI